MSVYEAPVSLGGEPLSTLRLAVRNARWLAIVAVCAAIVLVLVAMFLPASYVATTRLLPPQQNQSLATLFMAQSAGAPLASVAQKELGIKNPADIYIGLLNSRSVQDGLVHDFDLLRVYGSRRGDQARSRLAAQTQIQLTKEGLIAIAVEDRDPQRAAGLANGYAEQLRRTTKRLAMSEAAQRRQFFDEQVLQARQDLDHAESGFSAVQQRTGMLQLDAQARSLIDTAATLRGQISVGEVQLKAMRNFGTEENPDVRQQETRLEGWRVELSRLEAPHSSDPSFSKGQAPQQAQEYARAMREVRYHEVVLEMLLRQSEAAKLDEAKEATVIQVVDVAVPPEARSSPQRTAIVLLGTIATVMAALMFFALRERYRRSPEWQLQWEQLQADWGSR